MGIKVSRKGVAKFKKRFYATGKLHQSFCLFVAILNAKGTIAHQPGSRRKSIITPEICKIVEEQIWCDDKTTASQLHVHLTSHGYTLNL